MQTFLDLRQFMRALETAGDLRSIDLPCSPRLEITEVSRRSLRRQGPALLFQKPAGFDIPVLTNVFASERRIALGLGLDGPQAFRSLGEQLAVLRDPKPPSGVKELWASLPLLRQALSMGMREVRRAPCQEQVHEGNAVDLGQFPVQTCWPEDAGPLITWPLVVTRNIHSGRLNAGVYRLQVIGRNKVIMRWLAHRGGALDFDAWQHSHQQQSHPQPPFPVAVVIGADPASMLSAVMPIPDHLSEFAFAGLIRGEKTEMTRCITHDLSVPAHSEIVLEGWIHPNETALEGPFGDHTGYYNEVERFPVMTVERITHRERPIYVSTYTGRPPDEPSILGASLNEVFVPLLQQHFSEITDFYLPPEGCSYRIAVVSMRKQYPGHAKRVMMGVWSFLRQFMYTKFIIVVDEDINIRDWQDVMWALSTRTDPVRDSMILQNTPIDYLDFASPVSGLGSKMGLDATEKMAGETQREWGRAIKPSPDVQRKIDAIWSRLGL